MQAQTELHAYKHTQNYASYATHRVSKLLIVFYRAIDSNQNFFAQMRVWKQSPPLDLMTSSLKMTPLDLIDEAKSL